MVELKNVSFQYKDSEQNNCLSDINLTINDGEVVLLCGKSGCGKTTITRLVNGLIPGFFDGALEGAVLLNGVDIAKQPIHQTARLVGSVFQNPRSQFFNIDTTSEVVFGCENMGMPLPEIEAGLQQAVGTFGIGNLMDRNLFRLSGGEKQKIACASVSMSQPDILVLDEPASNLDWFSIQNLAEIIATWKYMGKTVIVAEHRLSYLKGIADRVVFMESGQIVEDCHADTFWKQTPGKVAGRGLRALTSVNFEASTKLPDEQKGLEIIDFKFSYSNGMGIDIPQLRIPQGAIVGIIGKNGAGKTTFARCLCGLEKKAKGFMKLGGAAYNAKKRLRLGYLVMQDVNHQLFAESVIEEVSLSIAKKCNKDDKKRIVGEILANMDLATVKDLHPLSLSGGQKQRVAIASAIAANTELLVFDEPTSGLDYHHMLEVANNLTKLSDMGKTIFIITHDPELIAQCCNHIVFMETGNVKWSSPCTQACVQKLSLFFKSNTGDE